MSIPRVSLFLVFFAHVTLSALQPVLTYSGHLSNARTVAFDPRSPNYILTCGADGVRIWNKASGTLFKHFITPANGGSATALAFPPSNSSQLLLGTSNGKIHLVARDTGTIVRNYSSHSGSVERLHFLNSSVFFSCSLDATVRQWDFNTGSQLNVFRHTREVPSFEMNTTNTSELVAVDLSGGIVFWDIIKGKARLNVTKPSAVRALAINPNSTTLLIGYAVSDTEELNSGSLSSTGTFTGAANALAWHPTSRCFVTGSDAGIFTLWTSSPNSLIQTYVPPSNSLALDVQFNPWNNSEFLSGHQDGSVYLWATILPVGNPPPPAPVLVPAPSPAAVPAAPVPIPAPRTVTPYLAFPSSPVSSPPASSSLKHKIIIAAASAAGLAIASACAAFYLKVGCKGATCCASSALAEQHRALGQNENEEPHQASHRDSEQCNEVDETPTEEIEDPSDASFELSVED